MAHNLWSNHRLHSFRHRRADRWCRTRSVLGQRAGCHLQRGAERGKRIPGRPPGCQQCADRRGQPTAGRRESRRCGATFSATPVRPWSLKGIAQPLLDLRAGATPRCRRTSWPRSSTRCPADARSVTPLRWQRRCARLRATTRGDVAQRRAHRHPAQAEANGAWDQAGTDWRPRTSLPGRASVGTPFSAITSPATIVAT